MVTKLTLVCEECSAEYQRYPSQSKGSRFCSAKCRDTAIGRFNAANHKAPWLTELNTQPGRNAAISRATAEKRGDKLRDRGKGKTYRKRKGRHEHRVVAEEQLGRPLEPSEVVHHDNENKRDNDPSNLSILSSKAEHSRLHARRYWIRKKGGNT